MVNSLPGHCWEINHRAKHSQKYLISEIQTDLLTVCCLWMKLYFVEQFKYCSTIVCLFAANSKNFQAWSLLNKGKRDGNIVFANILQIKFCSHCKINIQNNHSEVIHPLGWINNNTVCSVDSHIGCMCEGQLTNYHNRRVEEIK